MAHSFAATSHHPALPCQFLRSVKCFLFCIIIIQVSEILDIQPISLRVTRLNGDQQRPTIRHGQRTARGVLGLGERMCHPADPRRLVQRQSLKRSQTEQPFFSSAYRERERSGQKAETPELEDLIAPHKHRCLSRGKHSGPQFCSDWL